MFLLLVEFYEDITLDAADVIVDVLFYLEQPIDGSNILKVYPNETVCNGTQWYKPKPYYFNGDCFTLTLPGTYNSISHTLTN